MSPVHTSRHLLVWSLPTVAVLLGLLWYKKRRATSAPATTLETTAIVLQSPSVTTPNQIASEPEATKRAATVEDARASCSRSLSGVDSAPIDIKCARSAPIHMSDTELDLEIERMKLVKGQTSAPPPTPPPPTPRSNAQPARARSPDRDSANHSPCAEAIATPASPSLSSAGGGSAEHSDSDSGKGGSDVATPPPPRPKQQPQQQSLPPQQQQPQKQQIQKAISKQKQKLSKKQKRTLKFQPFESYDKLNEKKDDTNNVSVKAADSTITNEKITDQMECIIFEFIIPQSLVGRLIGRHGVFVHEIHEKTSANVLVKRHPSEGAHIKVCALEGTQAAVDEALDMIRARFPTKRHPELTLERITFAPVVPEFMYLRLIEGINNDTLISYIESPAHLFIQQPTHPTYPALATLNSCMAATYADEVNAPPVPWPATESTVCAATDNNGRWHRVSVVAANDEYATVQLLDYGGFMDVEEGGLRQIRADFIMLPFQAAQCYLADVGPPGEDGVWPQEAYDAVAELTTGAIVYTQILDYADDGVPLVRMYVPVSGRRTTLLLNNELVDRGVAQRVTPIQS